MAHRIPAYKMTQRTPHIPPPAWGHGVLGHAIGLELRRLAHEALQVLLCVLGRGRILFCHDSRAKEKQRSLSTKNLSSLSLF
jgi:hypothetical protein